MRRYVETLRFANFRRVWLGATASMFGDGMTWVALVWLVYDKTNSPEMAGALVFTYGAPVVVGGLLAGPALDRWGARDLILWDSLLRALVMLVIPLGAFAGIFHVAEAFAVAGLYGLLKMIPLAGVPSLIAEHVPEDRRNTANALESLSFSTGITVALPVGGFLIAALGAMAVLLIDAATFLLFAFLIARIPRSRRDAAETQTTRLRDGFAFIASQPQVRFITVMFGIYNIGLGSLYVALVYYAREILHGNSSAFGLLVASSFGAMLVGALVAGAIDWKLPLGRSVAVTQLMAGLAVLALVLEPPLELALVALALHGFFSAPLSIWAQTIRMAVIPAELRGRVFALIRTTIQATEPVGGAIGGVVVGAAGFVPAIWMIAATKAVPGAVGAVHPDMAEPPTKMEPAPSTTS
jgi:predicted MFS family arabinose efflux permease